MKKVEQRSDFLRAEDLALEARLLTQIKEEKIALSILSETLYTTIRKGGITAIRSFPLKEAVRLFNLTSPYVYDDVEGPPVTFDDGASYSSWTVSRDTDSFDVTQQTIECEEPESRKKLVVINRGGVFKLPNGAQASSEAFVKILEGPARSLQAVIRVNEGDFLLAAATQNFSFGGRRSVNSKIVGRFNFEGELVEAFSNEIDIQRFGGTPSASLQR